MDKILIKETKTVHELIIKAIASCRKDDDGFVDCMADRFRIRHYPIRMRCLLRGILWYILDYRSHQPGQVQNDNANPEFLIQLNKKLL